MVLRHRGGPQQVRQIPGVRNVALDRGDHRGRLAGCAAVDGQSAPAARPTSPRAPRRARCAHGRRPRLRPCRAGAPGRAEHQPGQAAAGEGDQEGQERRPADRDPPYCRCRRLAHDQPSPREALPWPPIAHRLGCDPPARHRERPGAQPQQQPLPEGEHREDHRLGHGERDPDVPGEIDQPGQQREEERQAEDGAGGQRDPARCRHSAMTSSAGPTAASGQIPAGGNAAASASPPASAVSSARAARTGWPPGAPQAAAVGTAGPELTSRTVPPLPEPAIFAGSCERSRAGHQGRRGRAAAERGLARAPGPASWPVAERGAAASLAHCQLFRAISRLQFGYPWDCSYPRDSVVTSFGSAR